MDRQTKKKHDLRRRHLRLRQRVRGTAARPRLAVYRSLRHIYAQLIDDDTGMTLFSASSRTKDFSGAGGNAEAAKKVGAMIAEGAIKKSISQIVFDRGGRKYHGRVKALAEAAREGGLQF